MTLMTIATQIATDAVNNDPRNQMDPSGDRDFGMMLLMMVVLGAVCLTVMWLFDKWRNRERRYNRAAIVMLGQASSPPTLTTTTARTT
jgi:hypothetical protein